MPSTPAALETFSTEYGKHYTITGGKEVKRFLNIEIDRKPDGSFTWNQKPYIERVFREARERNALA